MTERLRVLEALLREGSEEAWCDIVVGCIDDDPKRARRFRERFYDWRKRVAAAFGETWPKTTKAPRSNQGPRGQ